MDQIEGVQIFTAINWDGNLLQNIQQEKGSDQIVLVTKEQAGETIIVFLSTDPFSSLHLPETRQPPKSGQTVTQTSLLGVIHLAKRHAAIAMLYSNEIISGTYWQTFSKQRGDRLAFRSNPFLQAHNLTLFVGCAPLPFTLALKLKKGGEYRVIFKEQGALEIWSHI